LLIFIHFFINNQLNFGTLVLLGGTKIVYYILSLLNWLLITYITDYLKRTLHIITKLAITIQKCVYLVPNMHYLASNHQKNSNVQPYLGQVIKFK
jgi:hypothetical protein